MSNIFSLYPQTATIIPNSVTNIQLDPIQLPLGSNAANVCPAGQTSFVGWQNPGRYFYTCAATLDDAKSNFANQSPNQTWNLNRAQQTHFSGKIVLDSCLYAPNDPNTFAQFVSS